MRHKPDIWRGAARIQWGCVLMQLLGESNLTSLHLVLSGLRSVEGSLQAAPYQKAVRTARSILGEALTPRTVQAAVLDFIAEEQDSRSFDIDGDTLEFQARSDYDPEILSATRTLIDGLPAQQRTRDFADTSKHLVAHPSRDSAVPLRLHGVCFPAPETHNLERVSVGSVSVSWIDLEALASELDEMDREAGRQSRNWAGRLADIVVRVRTSSGLQQTDVLQLDGLRHLIGIPGSGKTTLIILLCILLARRGLRVAVFFTAIQVARDYLETLRGYDIDAGLLIGRATRTHLRHANRLSELVANREGGGGFARSVEGVDLLAQSCPLPAFADSWPEDDTWRFGEAPCERIYEAGSATPKLCPAWSLCGRVKSRRQLVNSPIWLGHIRGLDTTVPAHTSEERLRYFELVARSFDLVVVDEADEAQKNLDEYGAQILTLTGNVDSIHAGLLQTQSTLATNRTPVNNALLRYLVRANEFQGFTLGLVQEIRSLRVDRQDLASRYEDKLLTVGFLLREAIDEIGRAEKLAPGLLSALSDLWETAMYSAYHERDNENGFWPRVQRHKGVLGRSSEDCQDIWRRLNRAFRQYLALDQAVAREKPLAELSSTFLGLLGSSDTTGISPHVRLLTVAGFTIASYQRLAREARYLALRGELPEGDSGLGLYVPSPELREAVPRSILGTFTSVRFRRVPETEGFEIDYLVMDCTPRMLLHRLHDTGGANVLLASATSCLEPSSQYHVGRTPDIVLSPQSPQLGEVRMYFQPKLDRTTRRPIRFSGGGAVRNRKLRSMVTELATPAPSGRSDLERTLSTTITQSGRTRKAALVVNSYEQVRLVVDELATANPSLSSRTRGVLDSLPGDHTRSRFVTRGRVEEVGADPDVDVLVFPMGAIGRAMNIVFTDDEDSGRAAIGSIFFLTRPHPAAGDLGLMQSIVARETERLDSEDMRQLNLAEVEEVFRRRRYQAYGKIARLLARPMAFSQLDDETRRTFAANLLVSILQMVGRGIRRGMPVEVYFVDAAWAPNSADGEPESASSSTLVVMQDVLERCLDTPDPVEREMYSEIYGPFAEAFRDIDGVIPPTSFGPVGGEDYSPSPAGLEDAVGWDRPDTRKLQDVLR